MGAGNDIYSVGTRDIVTSMKRIPLTLLGLIILVTTLVFVTPVLAIDGPDSGPFIIRIDMYRHCLEEDDLLAFARYNVPYASPPDETIAQAYIGRLLVGSTEYARVSPYSYYNSGYGYGAFSMYLDAASAPTWGSSCNVSLEGSPTLDWSPSTPSVVTSSMNWRATTGTTATRALMYAHIIAYAEELSDYWSVALTTSTAEGTVLSTYGEAYFTNVVPELRTICPNLFTSSSETVTLVDTEWENPEATETTSSWPLDWGGISTWLGLPSSDEVLRTIIGFGIIFILCAMLASRTGRTDFTMIAGFGLMVIGAAVGMMSPIIVAGVTFAAVLLTGLVFLLGKATA